MSVQYHSFSGEDLERIVAQFAIFHEKEEWCSSIKFTTENGGKLYFVEVGIIKEVEE